MSSHLLQLHHIVCSRKLVRLVRSCSPVPGLQSGVGFCGFFGWLVGFVLGFFKKEKRKRALPTDMQSIDNSTYNNRRVTSSMVLLFR